MGLVRQRIEQGGERLWRFEDFRGLPFSAVAQALSRLTRQGAIERLSNATMHLAELIMNSAISKALKDKRVREIQ